MTGVHWSAAIGCVAVALLALEVFAPAPHLDFELIPPIFLASLERDVVGESDLIDCLLANQDDLCTPRRTERDVHLIARHEESRNIRHCHS